MKARLLHDVVSFTMSTKTKPYYYGKRMDMVTIAHENENNYVVENKQGIRFHIAKVNVELITESNN